MDIIVIGKISGNQVALSVIVPEWTAIIPARDLPNPINAAPVPLVTELFVARLGEGAASTIF